MESAQDQHGASSREAREAEAAYDLATECRARLERRFGW
jgi:hypothetical protein